VRWPESGVEAMQFLPSALNLKVKKFNQAWVNGERNQGSSGNVVDPSQARNELGWSR
jgi:hypothetical protein